MSDPKPINVEIAYLPRSEWPKSVLEVFAMQTPFPMDELDPDLYQRRVEGMLDDANRLNQDMLRHIADLEACIRTIKGACDRDWKDETPAHIGAIVSNSIFWRNTRIRELQDKLAALTDSEFETRKLLLREDM